jgi:hypothetical protein
MEQEMIDHTICSECGSKMILGFNIYTCDDCEKSGSVKESCGGDCHTIVVNGIGFYYDKSYHDCGFQYEANKSYGDGKRITVDDWWVKELIAYFKGTSVDKPIFIEYSHECYYFESDPNNHTNPPYHGFTKEHVEKIVKFWEKFL